MSVCDEEVGHFPGRKVLCNFWQRYILGYGIRYCIGYGIFMEGIGLLLCFQTASLLSCTVLPRVRSFHQNFLETSGMVCLILSFKDVSMRKETWYSLVRYGYDSALQCKSDLKDPCVAHNASLLCPSSSSSLPRGGFPEKEGFSHRYQLPASLLLNCLCLLPNSAVNRI